MTKKENLKPIFIRTFVGILIMSLLVCLFPMATFAEDGNVPEKRETIRVGFFAMDGYHMMDKEGNRSGYGYDFLRLMARYENFEYEYVGYNKSWSEMQKMLENGEIDMVTSARKTPERKEKFDFSKPIGTNECMMTVRKDNKTVKAGNYSTYDGCKVGLLKGNSRNNDFADFAKEKEFSYTPVYFEQLSHMEKALQTGKVDMLVSSSMRASENEKVVEKFAGEEIFAIVKEGNTELLNKINYAIDQIDAAEGDWQGSLFNRYYTNYEVRNLDFTDEEREIISQYSEGGHTLRVLCDPTRKPYSFVENGEVKGILPDYFRKVADYCGLSYEFIVCKSRDEYVAYQKKSGQVDIGLDGRFDTENVADRRDFALTAPYVTIRSAKVVRRDFKGEIKTVATVSQGDIKSIEDYFVPGAKKIHFDSRQEAMEAVKKGKADAAYVYYYMAQEFVNNDTSNMLVYTILPEPSFQYQMVVSAGVNHALAGILTKGIYAMEDRTIEDIAARYTSYKASDMDLKLLIQMYPMGAVALLILMVIAVIVFVVLVIKVRKQNCELKRHMDRITRDKQVLDKINEDYTVVFYVELNSGKFEALKLAEKTNADVVMHAKKFEYSSFDDYVRQYAQYFIPDDQRDEFYRTMSCANLKHMLSERDRVNFTVETMPDSQGNKFFAAQIIKVYENKTSNKLGIIMGFRHIDDIIEKEKQTQSLLKNALDEARLSNEIISAIAKNYFSIYRIDLENDFFEEISNDDETHHLTGNQGCASEKLREICDNLIAPEHREIVHPFMDISTLQERLKDDEYVGIEYKMCDGNWHRMRFVAKTRDENGMVTSVLCTVRSISEAKRRELNLLYEIEMTKREAEMKSQFLANMSHDIRTPLNGLVGLINMDEEYMGQPEMQQAVRNKAKDTLRYLVSLVNDVLDMNKLQSGNLKNQELNFDFVRIVRKVNKLYAEKAEDKGIHYEIKWDKARLKHQFLVGNPVYLGRILSNIADNAIKFSPPNSEITVWGNEEEMEDGRVMITLYCKDNGPGMDADFVAHAFDMFSQGNKTSRSSYEGSGLGLTIAQKLAESMGGSIELESEVGAGTTAIIKLPFKIGEPIIIGEVEDIKNVSVEGKRALIVEDNELNAEIARFMLESNGLEVEHVENGEEAVRAFEKSDPGYFDVVFMDIMMPIMNGLEATRAIRTLKRDDSETVPIIAMSANSFAEDIIESKLAGMNYHLSKPLDAEKMIVALKNCLTQSEVAMHLRDEL